MNSSAVVDSSDTQISYLSTNAPTDYPNFEGNMSWGCDALYSRIKQLQNQNNFLLKKVVKLSTENRTLKRHKKMSSELYHKAVSDKSDIIELLYQQSNTINDMNAQIKKDFPTYHNKFDLFDYTEEELLCESESESESESSLERQR